MTTEIDALEQFYKDITVLDTETTGIDPKECELVEVATTKRNNSVAWESVSSLYSTNIPIPPEVSAVHHITNKMVAGLPTFGNVWINSPNKIESILQYNNTNYYVAHKAFFDCGFINQHIDANLHLGEKIHSLMNLKSNWICTWRLSRRLLPDAKFTGLSFLRYYLDLDIPESNIPHRAGADVIVTGHLIDSLLCVAIEQELVNIDQPIAAQLNRLSWEPILYKVFPFGKHKNKEFKEIPTDYFIWALDNVDSLNENNRDFDADLMETIKIELESRT